jgi:hypothetical protein
MPDWKLAPVLFCLACAIGQAGAQMPKMRNAPSMLGSGLPNLSSIGAGNAAGLLGYCVKNKFISGASANPVVSGLMKKPGTTSSNDYAAGLAGQVVNGRGPPMSMNQVPAQMKSKACDMVLKKGATLM